MPERFDVDDMLARNPEINQEMLEEAKELDVRLRVMGIQRKGYDILSPFKRRRPPTPRSDPPAIRLRRVP